MKRQFLPIIIFLIINFLVFNFNCKKEEKDNNDAGKNKTEVNSPTTPNVEVFYLVPSPDDIFGFINDPNLYFKNDLLNPLENLDKYNTTKYMEFNFGVYSADLAYAAAFGKKDETKKYFNAVKTLSDKIGLSAIFNESLTRRINNLTTNRDSLIALSSDTYFDIIRYLERTNRLNTLALLAAGGWIETMYIITNLVDYMEHSSTMQNIADQKIVFNNLYKLLEQNAEDPNVKAVYDELKPLKQVFDEFKVVKTKDTSKINISGDKIIVGGNFQIVMSEQQFYKLRNVLTNIRNKLTLNQ